MVDKLYIMLPEFRISKFDTKKAREDYARANNIADSLLQQFNNSELAEDILESDTSDFKSWFAKNKEKYRREKPLIYKVKYDFNKSPQENSREARNNLLIDIMNSILTNSDTASKILNPGGFDYQKRAARIMTILEGATEKELKDSLEKLGIKLNQTIKIGDKTYNKPLSSYLLDLNLETLEGLAENLGNKMDPLSPRTQVLLHQQNMTGAHLIGIYANHNSSHALMQHTKLGLSASGAFTLNGKRLTSLHTILNDNKEYISKNNAGFLAASVDNVKDPVLAALNQNTLTADASMLLSRLGYNPIEIGLLMSQPIVKEITNHFFRENRSGKSKNDAIEDIIKKYMQASGETSKTAEENYEKALFLNDSLAYNILQAKTINKMTPAARARYYNGQVAVGYLFKQVMKTSDALNQLVQVTRSDSQRNAAGPTIADSEIKNMRVSDFLEKIHDKENSPLANADVIFQGLLTNIHDTDSLRKALLKSPLPYLQAFYTLGVEATSQMLAPYFPQFTKPFRDVINGLREKTKTGRLNVKTMNSIYNDLLAYIMSKTEFFGSEVTQGDNGNRDIITSSEKRSDFINNFPSYFRSIVQDNPDIAKLGFIQRLSVNKPTNSPVEVVTFRNVGRLSPTLRETYTRDWASLIYSNNKAARDLAFNLFRYGFFRNGFAFGPSTYMHLAPIEIRMLTPGYIDTLNSLINNQDSYEEFIDQYIYNHLNNRQLVPEIPEDSTFEFTDEKGNIKDMVELEVYKDSSSADKKIVKETQRLGADDFLYIYFDYIARKINGDYVYYKYEGITDNTDPNLAYYYRIDPLGSINSFIEYEYGRDAEYMPSVIKKDNTTNSNSNTATEFEDATTDEDTQDNPKTKTTLEDINSKAFREIYGVTFDTTTPIREDATNIKPNTDFKDAEGFEICGA